MVQMSGGNSSMEYDQETAIFSASCLEHDVVDILRMILDCALEPRSTVAASVGIHKNKQQFQLEKNVDTGNQFITALTRTAYGARGLGNPLLGNPANTEYLSASVLQQFQLENLTPDRIIVGGANVQNHGELVELVEGYLGHVQPSDGTLRERDPA